MILLTGATGYIGRDVFRELSKTEDVKIFSRKEVKYKNSFKGDISSINDVRSAMKDVDGVIHAAALIDHFAPYKKLYDINVNGTKNIFKAARERGLKKIVYISTIGVDKQYMTAYCVSKMEAEKIAVEYSRKINTSIIRPTRVYDEEKIKSFSRWFPMFDKNIRVHLVYKKSLVSSIISAYKQGKPKIYTIADKEPVYLHELYENIAKSVGFKPLYFPFSFVKIAVGLGSIMSKISRITKTRPLLTPEFILTMLEEENYDITLPKKELNYKPVETIQTWRDILKRSKD